jgi:hypothetical protein
MGRRPLRPACGRTSPSRSNMGLRPRACHRECFVPALCLPCSPPSLRRMCSQHGTHGGARRRGFLEELFPRIQEVFTPHVVKYSNTNSYITKEDAAQSGTGGSQEKVDWKVSLWCGRSDWPAGLTQGRCAPQVSSYMELHPSLGGQMQKTVECDKRLLSVSLPMLEHCDRLFSEWYRSKKGVDSIHELVRLQVPLSL